MNIQNQIKRTLSDSASIAYVINLLKSKVISNRTELAKLVCDHFKFYDTRNQVQLGGCLKALRTLEAKGHFTLPAAQRIIGPKSPHRLENPVPLPTGTPSKVEEIQDLKLILVQTADEMRIWNELMIEEHPLGNGPLVGRQIRYLISSRHGWLGCFGFAAPALQLSDRDNWIGWDKEQRQTHLHFIIGMSRFLIRPCVQCKNLASKVLSMSMASLADDFEKKYHYKPLLIESFVDTSKYAGTCYQATNWLKIGKTKGRGRQDRFTQSNLSTKAIYVYPIEKDFRLQMGLSENAGLGSLNIDDGLDGDKWAEYEFGDAPLGDARLSKRLVGVAAAKAQAPGRAFSGVAKGDWVTTKADYPK